MTCQHFRWVRQQSTVVLVIHEGGLRAASVQLGRPAGDAAVAVHIYDLWRLVLQVRNVTAI
jgi:hypothetical protein